MKDSNSTFQITLFKAIIVIYFIYIFLNSLGSSVSFFHDNAEFGIWAFISFFMISTFLLIIDIAIILFIVKTFKDKNKRVYILLFQSIICVVVYFGLNNMFVNANKWNEYDNEDNQIFQTDSAKEHRHDIYIEDKSQYHHTFIDGLANYNEPIKLMDNYIITGKDTTKFPNDLSLKINTTFNATKNNNKFLLTVSRINLTDLMYSFQLADLNNNIIDTKSGKAILGSMFFLASENDVDSKTGESYGSYEYWDKANDCWFVIRVGIGIDHNGKQRAMLNYGCDDKGKPALDLDECPTLRTE